mgnify:CR=1 FL=1
MVFQEAKEIKRLSDIQDGDVVCLAPAGNSSEKMHHLISGRRPDVTTLYYLDSYKNGMRSGLEVLSIDDSNIDRTAHVIVSIEREGYRKRIVSNLFQSGFKKVSYIKSGVILEECEIGREEKSVLYFIYDLEKNALNFEFVNSLCHAELERVKRGLDLINVVIVPRCEESVFDLSRAAVGGGVESDNRWLMDNVIVPSVSLLPTSNSFTVLGRREEYRDLCCEKNINTFPLNYSISDPEELTSHVYLYDESMEMSKYALPLIATDASKSFVKKWLINNNLYKNKVVAITLRECGYQKERNSDLKVWKEFADYIYKQGFYPVFVRDTYNSFSIDDLEGYVVFHEVSWNIYLRIAFYEVVFLNMMASTGPHVFCTHNRRVKYVLFNPLSTDGYSSSEEYGELGGIPVGRQYSAKTNFQLAVWGKDRSADLIVEEFLKMKKIIDESC